MIPQASASPCAARFELQIDRIRKTDARLIRKRRLHTVLSLGAVHLVVAARHVAPVQRRAERAQIDQKESPGLAVAANPRVLARHVQRRHDLDIHRVRDASATDA